MKKQLLLIAALSISVAAAVAQGTWVPQATGFPQASTGVFNISVADANTVWISSYDGDGVGPATNYRDYSSTIDGGATWIPGVVPGPTSHAWSQIFGLDGQTAWAVLYNAVAGWGGGIWKTTDGGVNWTQQGVGQMWQTTGISFPNVVHFWDANNGWAMGDPIGGVGGTFEMYTTTDGGTTWVPVPAANIPAALPGNEYGTVDHYEVKGDTIWFDTNKGRVLRSIDKGLNWTAAATGITVPTGNAMDIAFWNNNEGIARLFVANTGVLTAVKTIDGGLTWTPFVPVGNMLTNDIKYVPGTASRLVSTGANTAFIIGSSYSDDGGLNWTDIEIGTQRTALGVFDSTTMWAGGFTTSPSSDGIYKYELFTSIGCGDPLISSGIITAPDYTICFGDTLFITTSGANPPTVGTTFGFSVLVTTADISGNNDPLNSGSVVGGTQVVFPAPAAIPTTLANTGVPFAAGIYYFTPLVYGNATGSGSIFNLILDPACTYTGTSVMVTLYDVAEPLCLIGFNESAGDISVNAFQNVEGTLQLDINALQSSNLEVNIYDVTGRLVATDNVRVSLGANTHQLDISTLGAGAYIVRLNNDISSSTVKFVKN